MDKKAERSGYNKVLKGLATAISPLNFLRTKPTIFTRTRTHWVEFGHLHKFTFGPYLRVHFGIRILADTKDSLSLNGPDSDSILDPLYFLLNRRKYSFEYGESLDSTEKCIADISTFWRKVGEPWFKKWQDPQILLESDKSPLSTAEKKILQDALKGHANENAVMITQELLGAPR